MYRFRSPLALSLALACTVGVASLLPASAHADSPPLIPVQGTLYGEDGRPITGNLPVVFTLYADAGMAVPVWGDTMEVRVTNGLFTSYLGDDSPLNLTLFRNYGDLWLSIAVDGDTPMGPYRIATAPYAGFAQFCGDAITLDGQTREQIVTAAVTAFGGPYAPLDHRTLWSTIDGIPAGFQDGTDNVRTDGEIRTVVGGMGLAAASHNHAWSEITSIPAGFADGIDNVRSDAEIRVVVNGMSLAPASHRTPWSTIDNIPAGFADGVDNVRSDAEIRGVVGGMGLAERGRRVSIDTTAGSCIRTGYVNVYDQAIDYQCPDGRVMVGTHSIHSNGTEDRQYGFYCCYLRIAP